MNISFIFRVSFASMLITLLAACGQSPTATVPPSPLPPITQSPSSQVTPSPLPQVNQSPVATDVPTSQPTETPAFPVAVVLEAHATLPSLPAGKVLPVGPVLPVGIAVDTHDDLSVTFYGLDGSVMGEVPLRSPAGIPEGTMPSLIHVAAPYEGNLNFPLALLYKYEATAGLYVANSGQISTLVERQNIMGLVGVPGQPIMAYAIMEYVDPNIGSLRNLIYLGDLTGLPASPVLVIYEPESRAIVPVLIRTEEGVPVGIWYTRRPWGIGGDIIFDPFEGLYYFDFGDRTVYQALPFEDSYSAISPDQTLVAYSNWQNGLSVLSLRNLATGQTLALPLLPDSDRGAGNAIFSPVNGIAWKEVRGSLMDGDLYQTIRVANSEGLILAEIPETQLYQAAGLGEQVVIKLIGWTDEQNFLVQVYAQGKDDASAIVRININTGEITLLASGEFLGFVQHP